MEDTGFHSHQVHVLRHSFRPNEPFRAMLNELVLPEPNGPRQFFIYGSDQRVIERKDLVSHEFESQRSDAAKFMESKGNTRLQLDGDVEAKLVRKGGAIALQLLMDPLELREFMRIRDSLDMISFGHRAYALGFHATKLYTEIPFTQLRPIPEVKEGLARINTTLHRETSRHLYQIIPDHMVEQSVPRSLYEPDTTVYTEPQAS